ncbi:MAG TPA: MoxR family ATPase [Chromatiales bacterium]|nr:MoxR family ATPase [Thiotrichales bacterium]HIP69280.1 MoxR family ATPase [Chromatiales bacterium]
MMDNATDDTTSINDNLLKASQIVQRMRDEIGKAIIGQKNVIEEILIALLAGGHVLIEGVPGLGKTLLVRALAQTFGGDFARIQFTPDLMPADVTGHVIYDMKAETFNVRKGPIFTNLLLADEINRAPAKTQAALLEVMQEYQATIEGESLPVPPPFMTLATQNPLEQEGTYPLPEAQLDRFLLKILIDYPNEEEEQKLVDTVTNGQVGDNLDVSQLQTLVKPETIITLQKLAANVRVDQAVNDYAVRIVRNTRDWQGISIGAGPRGGIALIRAGRAAAVLAGRDFVTPDDIKKVALPALRHRIALSPELELEGHSSDEILTAVINRVEAPRQ